MEPQPIYISNAAYELVARNEGTVQDYNNLTSVIDLAEQAHIIIRALNIVERLDSVLYDHPHTIMDTQWSSLQSGWVQVDITPPPAPIDIVDYRDGLIQYLKQNTQGTYPEIGEL
jgi:hypothetical protein